MFKSSLRSAVLAAAMMVVAAAPARAGIEEGIAAFHNGDYVTAFAEFEDVRSRDPVTPPVMRPPRPSEPKPRAAAEYYLSRMYLEGRGVGADPDLGLSLLRRAAHQEYPAALVALSERYRTGEGVMRNRREAQRMIRRAMALGDTQAEALWNEHYAENPANELADLRDRGEIPDHITTERAPVGPVSRVRPRDGGIDAPLPTRGANDLVTDTERCPTSTCTPTVN